MKTRDNSEFVLVIEVGSDWFKPIVVAPPPPPINDWFRHSSGHSDWFRNDWVTQFRPMRQKRVFSGFQEMFPLLNQRIDSKVFFLEPLLGKNKRPRIAAASFRLSEDKSCEQRQVDSTKS